MASQTLEIHSGPSHVNFPRLLFLSPSHLSVARPSGPGLTVSSLIPQEWIGHYLVGTGGASSAIALTSLNCELFLRPDWKFFTVRDCWYFLQSWYPQYSLSSITRGFCDAK